MRVFIFLMAVSDVLVSLGRFFLRKKKKKQGAAAYLPPGGAREEWISSAALFHSLFPHVLENAQPDYTRRDSPTIGIIRTISRIDHIFITMPMAEARDFHCIHMSLRIWGSGPYRVTTQLCA